MLHVDKYHRDFNHEEDAIEEDEAPKQVIFYASLVKLPVVCGSAASL